MGTEKHFYHKFNFSFENNFLAKILFYWLKNDVYCFMFDVLILINCFHDEMKTNSIERF